MNNKNDNISFSIIDSTNNDDIKEKNNVEDYTKILNELNDEWLLNEDIQLPNLYNYHVNFTIKELLIICDYYGIVKEYKLNKCNKTQIIDILINYESNITNSDIVSRRKNMWFYINELKNDKFMKKYVIW